MTQQYHEGQEVEVYDDPQRYSFRRAKIVRAWLDNDETDPRGVPNRYSVQFPDGQRGVFSADHIRATKEQIEQELIANGERFLDAMGDEVTP